MTKEWLLKELDGDFALANMRWRNACKMGSAGWELATVQHELLSYIENLTNRVRAQMKTANQAPDNALIVETRDPECPAKTQE